MKYNCKNCEFETDIWTDAKIHAFENIGHYIGLTTGEQMTTETNPV